MRPGAKWPWLNSNILWVNSRNIPRVKNELDEQYPIGSMGSMVYLPTFTIMLNDNQPNVGKLYHTWILWVLKNLIDMFLFQYMCHRQLANSRSKDCLQRKDTSHCNGWFIEITRMKQHTVILIAILKMAIEMVVQTQHNKTACIFLKHYHPQMCCFQAQKKSVPSTLPETNMFAPQKNGWLEFVSFWEANSKAYQNRGFFSGIVFSVPNVSLEKVPVSLFSFFFKQYLFITKRRSRHTDPAG